MFATYYNPSPSLSPSSSAKKRKHYSNSSESSEDERGPGTVLVMDEESQVSGGGAGGGGGGGGHERKRLRRALRGMKIWEATHYDEDHQDQERSFHHRDIGDNAFIGSPNNVDSTVHLSTFDPPTPSKFPQSIEVSPDIVGEESESFIKELSRDDSDDSDSEKSRDSSKNSSEPFKLNSAYQAFISQSQSQSRFSNSPFTPQPSSSSSSSSSPFMNLLNPGALVLYKPMSTATSSSKSEMDDQGRDEERGGFEGSGGKWWNGIEEREYEERDMQEVTDDEDLILEPVDRSPRVEEMKDGTWQTIQGDGVSGSGFGNLASSAGGGGWMEGQRIVDDQIMDEDGDVMMGD